MEVTSFKITEALPAVRLLLRAILPNVLWLTSSPLLLRMAIGADVEVAVQVMETPAAFGFFNIDNRGAGRVRIACGVDKLQAG